MSLIHLNKISMWGKIMPVHRTKSGGYQWGKTGKVYYGKDAKQKAQKQGIAIRLSGWKEKKK